MCAPCVSCCSAKVIQLIVRASWSLAWEGALRKDQAGPETEGKKSGQRNSSSCLNTEQEPGGEEITPLQAVLVPVGWRGRLATPSHTSEVGVSCSGSPPPPCLSPAGSATSTSWLTSACTRKSRVRQRRSSVDSGRSSSLSGFVCSPRRSCSD